MSSPFFIYGGVTRGIVISFNIDPIISSLIIVIRWQFLRCFYVAAKTQRKFLFLTIAKYSQFDRLR